MTIMQQQMVVAGLRILQNYIENTKEPEQPPLPEMKNNDQRKEWLRNYKSWGLWYTDHHTGVRYYKYDFQNGAPITRDIIMQITICDGFILLHGEVISEIDAAEIGETAFLSMEEADRKLKELTE